MKAPALWMLLFLALVPGLSHAQERQTPTTTLAKFLPSSVPLSASLSGSAWLGTVGAGALNGQVAVTLSQFDLGLSATYGMASGYHISWYGLDLSAPVWESDRWKLSLGGSAGRYGEHNESVDRADWTIAPSLDVQRTVSKNLAAYAGARWVTGIEGLDGRYGIPVVQSGVRISNRLSPRERIPQHGSLFLSSGLSPGSHSSAHFTRPVVRAGAGIPLGSVRLDVFGEIQYAEEMLAHREGGSLMIPLVQNLAAVPALSVEVGLTANYLTERLESGESYSAVFGGLGGALGWALTPHWIAQLQTEVGWGQAPAGHIARMDAALLGMRYRF